MIQIGSTFLAKDIEKDLVGVSEMIAQRIRSMSSAVHVQRGHFLINLSVINRNIEQSILDEIGRFRVDELVDARFGVALE